MTGPAQGIHQHPTRKLGRRPPTNAPALRLAPLLTGVVPAHPDHVDYLHRATYGLYANDTYGDCGPVSVANYRRLTTAVLTAAEHAPTLADVFDLYRRSGNPHFDPTTGADDNGVIMQTMLEAVHNGGIGGVKCVAFAKVDTNNLEELRAAVAIFGGVLLGCDLETAQQDQTDTGVWDYAPSPDWGGHAVLAGQYDVDSVDIITWQQLVECRAGFLRRQVDEAWVVIWPEHLRSGAFLAGVDPVQLRRNYRDLTGRSLPEPDPGPVVPPFRRRWGWLPTWLTGWLKRLLARD